MDSTLLNLTDEYTEGNIVYYLCFELSTYVQTMVAGLIIIIYYSYASIKKAVDTVENIRVTF